MPATSSPQHWAGQRQAVRGTGRPQATTLHASQLGHTSCIMRPREAEVEPHTWRVPGPHTDIPLCWAGSGGVGGGVVFSLGGGSFMDCARTLEVGTSARARSDFWAAGLFQFICDHAREPVNRPRRPQPPTKGLTGGLNRQPDG